MTSLVRLYGLTIASEIPLLDARVAEGPADLVVERGLACVIPDQPPPGRLLGELRDGDKPVRSLVARDDGYVFRFHGLGDFEVSPDLAHVTVHPHAGADEGLLGVLLGATVLAMILLLRGDLVLHASAVEIDGVATAFVGAPGMGKSTIATLCALRGARLVTDDLARIDDARRPQVWAGSSETRLRTGAADLARAAEGGSWRLTADGRTAYQPIVTALERVPLRAVVVPQPVRTVAPVRLDVVPPKRALLLLSRYPRVLGWSDRATRAREFEQLSALVEAVPVLAAAVPWSDRPHPSLADELLDAIARHIEARAGVA